MLTCYVIDDELHAIKSLLAYIEKTPLLHIIGFNENPLTALTYFQEQDTYPDITFLDIDMPQISGIELSSLLKGKTAIVFTTAHPNFAIDAFELEISDYLLKPISYQRFLKCIHRLNDHISQRKIKDNASKEEFIYVQTEGKGKLTKIFLANITYIESQKNYIAIATPEKNFLTYLTLTEIEGKLPTSFIRISKSYIINTAKINHVEGNDIFLVNNKECFAIGPGYKDAFINHMKQHLVKTKRTQG